MWGCGAHRLYCASNGSWAITDDEKDIPNNLFLAKSSEPAADKAPHMIREWRARFSSGELENSVWQTVQISVTPYLLPAPLGIGPIGPYTEADAERVLTCGVQDSEGVQDSDAQPAKKCALVAYHGWGESAKRDYQEDRDFKRLIDTFMVEAYIPVGSPSECRDNGKVTGTNDGWGHYLSDNKGEAEDELCLVSLASETKRAHRLLAHLHKIYDGNVCVTGYSMGFGFAVHVLATLPAGIQVRAFLGMNGMIMKCTEPYLHNLAARCKSFTVQWATPFDDKADVGDYFFRKWAQDATRARFEKANLVDLKEVVAAPARGVNYKPDLLEDHNALTRFDTWAHWLLDHKIGRRNKWTFVARTVA